MTTERLRYEIETTATAAAGTAKESFTVPNQRSLLCVRLHSQMFSSTTTNGLDLLGTNYGRILVGN